MTPDSQALDRIEAEAKSLAKTQTRKLSALAAWKSLKPARQGAWKTDQGMRLFQTIASLGYQIQASERRIAALLDGMEAAAAGP